MFPIASEKPLHGPDGPRQPWRCAISADVVTFADTWQTEHEGHVSARQRSAELNSATASPTAAATIAVVVAATAAKAVVEVGTGSGLTGLAIIQGMSDDGVLTTIDADGSHQATAKDVFAKAGVDHGHARLINGAPDQVLPRLADGAYDAVVVNQLSDAPEEFVNQALRLLRVGGALIISGFLGEDALVVDPANRDAHAAELRGLSDAIKTHEGLVSVLLPMSDGLLISVKKS